MTSRRVVVRPHVSNYPDPVRLRQGDRVTIGRRDPEHPGWVRVTDPAGRAGWAPEALLEHAGEHEATATEDYDATELDVLPGDELVVHRHMAGWLWVSDRTGRRGWVPTAVTAGGRQPGSAGQTEGQDRP